MKKFLGFMLLVVTICFFNNAKATHIVGGYISYTCIGSVSNDSADYNVTFNFYRDCENGDTLAFPVDIPITIFNNNSQSPLGVSVLTNLISFDTLDPNINNPCIVAPSGDCVEEYIFQGVIRLSRARAHTLVFQRCCKSAFVDNILGDSDTHGSSYTANVPSFNVLNCNSSPIYNDIPPLYFCIGFDVNIDLSATDPDGDSLVYSLCNPLDFPQGGNPRPVPAFAPPYADLPFDAGFSATNPFPANPQLAIDPNTGRLSGTPLTSGRYVFGLCIEEYRNGQLINVFRRETEVTTQDCQVQITSAIQEQTQFCTGYEIEFTNKSTGDNQLKIDEFFWDFGVAGTNADTSSTADTVFTFTYPAAGEYIVTLISYPSFFACSDTTMDTITVRDPLNPGINKTGSFCADGSDITVNPNGVFDTTTTFIWNFGTQANINTSTLDTVSGINYPNGIASYPIQLIATQDICSDTVNDVISLLPPPTASFTLDDPEGCFPHPVTFTSSLSVNALAEYEWDFGDDSSSTEANPTHTYLKNGYFDVKLTIRTLEGCIDTLKIQQDSAVFISLNESTNNISFTPDPITGCPPLEVDFSNTSTFEGNAQFDWTFGDGNTSVDQSPINEYQNSGFYDVTVRMITLDKCVDTLFLRVDSAIVVSPDSGNNKIGFDYFPKDGCLPLTVQFSDSSNFDGDAKYFWDFGDGTLDTIANPIKTYSDTGRYSIGLLLITSGECIDTLLDTLSNAIRVLPVPSAQINASDSASSLKTANFNFTNNGSEFVTNSRYLINGEEVGTADILNYQFLDTGRFEVTYIASNEFGCEDTSTANIFVFDEFEFIIPNVFTPNKDGINDEFAMRSCGVYDFEITIYNRFGSEIFASNSLNINWDGRVNGRKAADGVYFYTIRILDFRGDYVDYNGTVTLLRN